jgi:hypothetical protein
VLWIFLLNEFNEHLFDLLVGFSDEISEALLVLYGLLFEKGVSYDLKMLVILFE